MLRRESIVTSRVDAAIVGATVAAIVAGWFSWLYAAKSGGDTGITGGTGFNVGTGANVGFEVNPAPLSHFVWLLCAGGLLVLALFLLNQSVAFHRWLVPKEENAPNPYAGSLLGYAFSAAVLLLYSAAWWGWVNNPRNLWSGILFEPEQFIAPVLVASVVPGAIALYKFLVLRPQAAAARPDGSFTVISASGVVFAVIQLTASIATLIMFFRS